MRGILILIFCLCQTVLFAQFTEISNGNSTSSTDRLNGNDIESANIKEFERPPVQDYKIISISRDTTYVDTTLNINKDYKFNYLRKDRYGLLPFANTGQTNNTLIYDFNNRRTTPGYIANARHFAYLEVEDINYYHLPTPLTELYYRSAFEQGQQLDASFALNIHPRLNVSIAYKGVRSLGKYQNALTSTGNFRFAGSYRTENDRYHIRAHWVAQDLSNQENGGLTEQGVEQFSSGGGDFSDRSRLPVNFEDAENILDGTRVYVNHHYNLVQKNDSLKDYSLRVGHIFNSENKFYTYEQETASEIFGEAFRQTDFADRTDHEELYNEFNAVYEDKKLGELKFQANSTYYNYGYNVVLLQDADGDGERERVPNRLQGTNVAVGGAYKNTIGGFDIEGEAQVNVTGDFDGYSIYGEAGYALSKDKHFSVSVLSNERAAGFNHLLFQSNYLNYNWFNQDNYATVKTNTLAAQLASESWVNIDASVSNIDDYAYFGLGDDGLVESQQAEDAINHLKISANKDIKLGKFNLDLTATYQNVTGQEGVLNVPDLVGRGSFYFTDRLFKKALFLQTGITANYFTKYNLNGYDPILAEFYVQNTEEIGDFPLLDFFINMKVRQTRIFIKAEHFNSSITGSDFYSAPGYPYRDFNIRFGIVWNFFL